MSRTLFGTDEIATRSDELIEALSGVPALFRRTALPWGRLPGRLPLPANRAFRESRTRLDDAIHRLVRKHHVDSATRGGLLSRPSRSSRGDRNSESG